MGITPKRVDRLFISIYSLIIHLEISIQNISLVLSCEPPPNCRLKATNNCLNTLCVMEAIFATRGHKHCCFLPGGNNTSLSLMFLSLKLDIGGGGNKPTIKHKAPSWSYNLLLGQNNKGKWRTCKNTQEQNIKGETKYITHHNLNIIS